MNLGALVGTYCATSQDSTRMTLNLLMLCRETQLPIEVSLGYGGTSTGEPVTLYGKYVDGLRGLNAKGTQCSHKVFE